MKMIKKYFLVCIFLSFFGQIFASDASLNRAELLKNVQEIKKTIETLQIQVINIERLLQSTTTQPTEIKQTKDMAVITTASLDSTKIVSPMAAIPSVSVVEPVVPVQPIDYNKLVFVKKEIKKIGNGYFVVLQFKPLKNTPFAENMRFEVSLPENAEAEIKDISYAKLKSGKASKSILSDGKSATLVCTLCSDENLVITMLFTMKTIITVKGNNGLETLILDFEK